MDKKIGWSERVIIGVLAFVAAMMVAGIIGWFVVLIDIIF